MSLTLEDVERLEKLEDDAHQMRKPFCGMDYHNARLEVHTVMPALCALAREALTARTGWQPIETAPKNCAILLAGRYVRSGKWDIQSGEWSEPNKRFPFTGEHLPTHWMPLPAPPTPMETEK